MSYLNNKLFINAQISIEGNIIQCENHSIQIANITQIWDGDLPKKPLPLDFVFIYLFCVFIGFSLFQWIFIILAIFVSSILLGKKYLSKSKLVGINIELCSGAVYSFVSDNLFFNNQVYELFNEILIKNKTASNYNISFEGNGEITDKLEITMVKSSEETKRGNEPNRSEDPKIKNSPIYCELQVMYSYNKEKEVVNDDILTLIGQTAIFMETNDKEGIKKSFSQFITLGLINDCNELGLNLLIEEIKKYVF